MAVLVSLLPHLALPADCSFQTDFRCLKDVQMHTGVPVFMSHTPSFALYCLSSSHTAIYFYSPLYRINRSIILLTETPTSNTHSSILLTVLYLLSV